MKFIFVSLPIPFTEEPMNPLLRLGILLISSHLKERGFTDLHLVDYNL